MSDKSCLSQTEYSAASAVKADSSALLESILSDGGNRSRRLLLLLSGNHEADSQYDKLLIKLLESISASSILPAQIVLMNQAVYFGCAGNEALGSLCRMEAQGTEIAIAKASAEEYKITEQICCGKSYNTDELWYIIAAADKVITL